MNRPSLKTSIIFFLFLFLIGGCSSDQQKTDTFIKEANLYFENQEYDKAKIQLKNAIKLDTKSIQAYRLLAQINLKQKNAQEAFSSLLRLEQLEPDNLETKIQLASFYLLAKERIEAEKRIEAVLAKDPNNIKALYLHAGVLGSKNENLEQIKQVYGKILELDPKQSRAILVLAKIYQAQGDFNKAEENLKQAVQIDPDNINLYKALFGFYLSQKKFDASENVLQDLVQQRPNDFEPQVMLANFYGARQDNIKAEAAFLKAVELAPENITPHMLIARFYNSMEQPQKAEKFIKKALKIDPEHVGIKTAYADFHFVNKNIEQAEKLTDEILAERPDYIPAKLLKGKLFAYEKKLDEAIRIFQALIKDEPESPLYNFLLGSALLETGKSQQALPYFTKTLEKNPRHFKARLVVADLHYRKKDYFLAEAEAKKALEILPKNYNALLLMGNIHGAKKEYDTAQIIFKDLIRMDPENPAAYFRLGSINMIKKNPAAALENLETALAINPNLMDVFTNIISLHASSKNFKTALAKCDAHLPQVKDNPIVTSIILNLKGSLLLETKEVESAKKALILSIEKNPQFIQPYLTLTKIYNSEKNDEKELQTYKDLIKHRPDQAGPQSFIGTLYEKKGKQTLAEDHYKKALTINPEYIPAMNNLAFLYAQQDRELNTALELARKSKEIAGEIPAIMDTLGWVYYKKQLYDSALSEFKNCLEKEPNNPIFHYHLGLAYNKKWEYANAEKSLKKALELQNDFDGSDDARKLLKQM